MARLDETPPFMWQQKLEEAKAENARLQADVEALTTKLGKAIEANHSFAAIQQMVQAYFKKPQASVEDFEKFLADVRGLQARLDARFTYKVIRVDSNSSRLSQVEAALADGYEIYAVRDCQVIVRDKVLTVNDYILKKRVEE